MATVRARGARGKASTVTVVARGDRVLLGVGTAEPVSLSPEQAGDLLGAVRAEFHHAASAKLDSMSPRTGRHRARPTGAGTERPASPYDGGAR